MLSVANDQGSVPIAFRLYFPKDWAADPVRREKAGVPDESCSIPNRRSRWTRSMRRSPRACRRGGVGGRWLRDQPGVPISAAGMGLTYAVGSVLGPVWPPGAGPLPPKPWTGQAAYGRRRCGVTRITSRSRSSTRQALPAEAWRDVAWREGRPNAIVPVLPPCGFVLAHRDTGFHPNARRVAAGRMAGGGKRADQILALGPGGGYSPR